MGRKTDDRRKEEAKTRTGDLLTQGGNRKSGSLNKEKKAKLIHLLDTYREAVQRT